MRKVMVLVGLLLAGSLVPSFAASKKRYGYGTGSNTQYERVEGHYRKNGTYVEPYYRTKANDTESDNYNTRGNYNPWKGTYGNSRWDDND